jgi:hypothetical protein
VAAADLAVYGTAQLAPHPLAAPPGPISLPDFVTALVKAQSKTLTTSDGEEEPLVTLDGVDPLHVSMAITVRIPEVALDLTYDLSKGRHLVLAVRTLEMQLFFRPRDLQVTVHTVLHLSSSHFYYSLPDLFCHLALAGSL